MTDQDNDIINQQKHMIMTLHDIKAYEKAEKKKRMTT